MPPKAEVDIYYMNEKTGESYDLESLLDAKYEAERKDQIAVMLGVVAAVATVAALVFMAMSMTFSIEEIYKTAFVVIGLASFYGLIEIAIAARHRLVQTVEVQSHTEPAEA